MNAKADFTADPRPVTVSTTDRLRSAVLAGEFRPGDRLYEERLSERFGVSRTPIRTALQALASDGLLDHAPHRGYSVRSFDISETLQAYEIRAVLEASNGRAFVLFASHRALREAAELLKGGPWPLFVQGEAPRPVLLERFRASGNGVLLGAASFREGVDVAGDALSVVVIDKLPFAAPDDPVFEARLDAIRRNGGNPFRDEQLPQAVIALKQGAGRLIRNENDRGVLVLCDPRLTSKTYGSVFLNSLPPLPRTRRVEDVQAFFAPEEAAAPLESTP